MAKDNSPRPRISGDSDARGFVKIQAHADDEKPTNKAKPAAVPPKKVTLRPSCSYLDVGPDGKTVNHCEMRKCANGKDQYLRVTEQGGATDLQLVCGLSDSDPGSLAVDEFYKTRAKVSRPNIAPNTTTLANFPNIFWSDVKSYEAPTDITVANVRLKLLPVKYVWSFGDGETMTLTDPGKAYDPNLIKVTQDADKYYKNIHRYASLGTFNVTLTVVFDGQYSVDGGDWTDIAGSVQATSPPHSLVVKEARGELVDPHGN
ncbi:MAG: hypothetical protein ACRD3Q_19515 [Terriglobales bacterium]